MRCLKARAVSWLTNSQQGAVVPLAGGGELILAVYNNGRYVSPAVVQVPNDASGIAGWGPDGPVKPPETPPGGGPPGG